MEATVVTGHEQVIERLRALDSATEKKIFRVGLKAGAGEILPTAQAYAPEVSGKMKANLKIRNGGSSKTRVTVNVGASNKDFTGDAFYTPFVLWGHKVGRRPLKSLIRLRKFTDTRATVPGDDFIAHAFEETKDKAIDTAMKTMVDQVDAIAAGKST